MIDTFVRYVRNQTSVNVLRIEATATASGIAMAGIVPKTKSRMTSAPRPPMSASVMTLGPLPPPLEALSSASRPVRFTVTPAGAAERSAWHLGRHYKWIDSLAIVWIFFISIVFLLPFAYVGIPWNKGFDWNFLNYTPITVGGALLLFGGWWLVSANGWFKGPVRQGTDEELEQIEAQYGGTPTAAPAVE